MKRTMMNQRKKSQRMMMYMNLLKDQEAGKLIGWKKLVQQALLLEAGDYHHLYLPHLQKKCGLYLHWKPAQAPCQKESCMC
jgi:hypothetical protein